ncbi:MAG TPA: response regulator transcription factor [Terracidiphilus sp.]|jgi:DNA-binding response OmpR family regulator|nr:response regulator transcription factor [Terracidiphilus sp.]
MSRILIVEDEPAIAFTLENDLEAEGYEVAVVADGVEAVRRALSEPFDLILLDVMLPNKDGFEVCRDLRRGGLSTRIIMLTAKTQEAEKILGLDMGADDYVTKPFSPRELRARIRAMLRRTETEAAGEVHRFGRFELDLARFELRREGKQLEATHTELKLLTAFIRSRGRVLKREQLLEAVWGSGVFVSDRVVDYHIVALRKKIEDDPAAPRHLVSVRGVGYRFDG